MDTQIFVKLEKAVERPCRQRDWFGLAEQAINTVYALGEHPDEWCASLIKKLTRRVFGPKENRDEGEEDERMQEDKEEGGGEGEEDGKKDEDEDQDQDGDVSMSQADMTFTQQSTQTQGTQGSEGGKKDTGDAFELSQLFFVVGHVAIKQIVFLELVERECKRQKDEKLAGTHRYASRFPDRELTVVLLAEKQASGGNKSTKDKDGEELDQVAGNAEDEIGDRIQAVRETELLFGEQSLLSLYGPMLVHVCGSPHRYKVRFAASAA